MSLLTLARGDSMSPTARLLAELHAATDESYARGIAFALSVITALSVDEIMDLRLI